MTEPLKAAIAAGHLKASAYSPFIGGVRWQREPEEIVQQAIDSATADLKRENAELRERLERAEAELAEFRELEGIAERVVAFCDGEFDALIAWVQNREGGE